METTARQNGKQSLKEAVDSVIAALEDEDALDFMDGGTLGKHVLHTKNIIGMTQFKMIQGENGLCFSVQCDHSNDDPWCGHLDRMFELGYERMLLAFRQGTSFNLTVPVYPELSVGMTVHMQWNNESASWVTTLPLEGESGSQKYDVGTFNVLSRRAHFVSAIEELFVYVADVNTDLRQSCERCGELLEDEETPRDLIIMGMTGLCVEHYRKAKSFEDVAPDATSNTTSVPTMREMTSVDDVPLGTGMMTDGVSAHHTQAVDDMSIISGPGMSITGNDRHTRERLDEIFRGDQYRGS